jgi:hypothetical protein
MWFYKLHQFLAPTVWIGQLSMLVGLVVFGLIGFAWFQALFGDEPLKQGDSGGLMGMTAASVFLQFWVFQVVVALFLVFEAHDEIVQGLRDGAQWLKKYPERKRLKQQAEIKRLETEAAEALELIGVTTFTDAKLKESLDQLEREVSGAESRLAVHRMSAHKILHGTEE